VFFGGEHVFSSLDFSEFYHWRHGTYQFHSQHGKEHAAQKKIWKNIKLQAESAVQSGGGGKRAKNFWPGSPISPNFA
jgi:hypothetical protein